jgi:energy-coupling factor transporter ATP-binding protein EcfA2
MPENILYIEDLGLDFQGKTGKKIVLDHLNLTQKKGEWLALIGPKGAGKTSLGLIIKGILSPTRGKLKMFSENPEEDLKQRKIKIGFLFSNPKDQICSLTVKDDVAFGPFHSGLSKKEVTERIEEALNILKISHLSHQPTHKISGGELQKVALAGLFALRPDYMILDEPATFLSSKDRDELLHLLKAFHRRGKSILYIASSWEEISVADRVAILNKGGIIKTTSPKILMNDEKILDMSELCLPDIRKLAIQLRRFGLAIPDFIQNVDQMVQILQSIFKGKKLERNFN